MEITVNKKELLEALDEQIKDLNNYGGEILYNMYYMILGKVTTLNELGILSNKECANYVNTLANMQIKYSKKI